MLETNAFVWGTALSFCHIGDGTHEFESTDIDCRRKTETTVFAQTFSQTTNFGGFKPFIVIQPHSWYTLTLTNAGSRVLHINQNHPGVSSRPTKILFLVPEPPTIRQTKGPNLKRLPLGGSHGAKWGLVPPMTRREAEILPVVVVILGGSSSPHPSLS